MYDRGRLDCYQDRCENIPFASIGGLNSRLSPKAPKYIPKECSKEYVSGYTSMSIELFGENWETCEFSWQHAMTIGRDDMPT